MDTKKTEMFWWLSPRKDEHYQWWWGYEAVRMIKLPNSEKQKYLEKMRNTGNNTDNSMV